MGRIDFQQVENLKGDRRKGIIKGAKKMPGLIQKTMTPQLQEGRHHQISRRLPRWPSFGIQVQGLEVVGEDFTERLKDVLGRIILVSHQEEVADAFPNNKYLIELIDGTSRVSLMAE